MLPLKLTVKAPEGCNTDQKGKLVIGWIDQARDSIGSRFYHFKRCIGSKADFSLVNNKSLCLKGEAPENENKGNPDPPPGNMNMCHSYYTGCS